MAILFQHAAARRWLIGPIIFMASSPLFQHAAARRWLSDGLCDITCYSDVSTRSRPKVAERQRILALLINIVSTRSRPKVADWRQALSLFKDNVSTRSRPKAAEASSETLATQGFYSLKSPKSPKKAQSEYSTAFSRHTCFAKFLIVKEPSRFANLTAF